jgi:hypothetical protein
MGKENRFAVHMHAMTKATAAEFRYDHAASELLLSRAELRAAELASQAFEDAAKGRLYQSIGEITDREREIALRFVRYAVFGRTDKDD